MKSTPQGELPLTTIGTIHGVEYHLDAPNLTGPVSVEMSPCRRDHPKFWDRAEKAAWFVAIMGYEPTKVEMWEKPNGYWQLAIHVTKTGRAALVRRQKVTGEEIPQ